MFGGADLAAELGVELAWEPFFVARAKLVQAAASAGRFAIDMPWVGLDDEEGELAEMKRRLCARIIRARRYPSTASGTNSRLAGTRIRRPSHRRGACWQPTKQRAGQLVCWTDGWSNGQR